MIEQQIIKKLHQIGEFSRYLGKLFERQEVREWLVKFGLIRQYPFIELYRELKQEVLSFTNLNEIKRTFRKFKQRHFLRLGARDFLGNISFEELVSQLSNIAEVCLQTGLEAITKNSFKQKELQNCSFSVLGLGKLGGKELNYVSDIDLIYLYRQEHPRVECTPCTHLARQLNDIIGDMFEGDRVFKVDMRLRPKGRYGELVQSYEGVLEHYLLSGASWERQALLKARGVAGDRKLASRFLTEIRPFVFRRFLDFQAINEIKSMRDRVLEEVENTGEDYPENVKLGIGGIREVEFIVQALQLIYGGRYPELNDTNTLSCLEKLNKLNLIPDETKAELREGYIFLRRVEHWIQLDGNKQSSKIPKSIQDRQRLSSSLGFKSIDEFFSILKKHAITIHSHFKDLFTSKNNNRHKKGILRERGSYFYIQNKENTEKVSVRYFSRGLQKGIKYVLDNLNNLLSPDSFYECSKRIVTFLNKVEKRPGLIDFLEQHQEQFIEILTYIGRSKFIFHILNYQPSLIEGVIGSIKDEGRDMWQEKARKIILPLGLEDGMEWIRKLKNERIILLTLLDIKGELELEDLLIELTELAEFVITATYEKILSYLNISSDFPLGILALGKLGSKELGYFSDLDLMYVYEPKTGEDPDIIPQEVIKIVQRLNNALKIPLQEGPGYEVDTRLRPTGNYGPLIVTLNRWKEYYEREADVWELQSLLKLRPIAGNPFLCDEITRLKHEIYSKDMDSKVVWNKISHMRDRIINERARESEDSFDIKVGYGGLIDLEFFVQGMALSGKISVNDMWSQNTLSVLNKCLEIVGKDRESINIFCQVYRNWMYLIQRIQLLTNLSSFSISKRDFLKSKEVGLWPPKNNIFIEEFEDIKKYKKIVDKFWKEVVCNFCST